MIWIHLTVGNECLNKAKSKPRLTGWQYKKGQATFFWEIGSLLEVADFGAMPLKLLGIMTLKEVLKKKSNRNFQSNDCGQFHMLLHERGIRVSSVLT